MMTRIFFILLCLGIPSTLEGCYIVDPYPYDDRPYYRQYRRPYHEREVWYRRGYGYWYDRPYESWRDR